MLLLQLLKSALNDSMQAALWSLCWCRPFGSRSSCCCICSTFHPSPFCVRLHAGGGTGALHLEAAQAAGRYRRSATALETSVNLMRRCSCSYLALPGTCFSGAALMLGAPELQGMLSQPHCRPSLTYSFALLLLPHAVGCMAFVFPGAIALSTRWPRSGEVSAVAAG